MDDRPSSRFALCFAFEDIDREHLEHLPLAARRALDRCGYKLSLSDWQAMPVAARTELSHLGAADEVEVGRVARLLEAVRPSPERVTPCSDPPSAVVPSELAVRLGAGRPLDRARWAELHPLERYALAKVASREATRSPASGAPSERLARAYDEIVVTAEPQAQARPSATSNSGATAGATPTGEPRAPYPRAPHPRAPHWNERGEARMVEVGAKEPTQRLAVASATVHMDPATAARLESGTVPKGDVFAVARVAGIQAAKRTPELIPLCHTVAVTGVEIAFRLERAKGEVEVRSTVRAFDRTGVEMEALVAASVAALTIYDMLKGLDRDIGVTDVVLVEKHGGRSGPWQREHTP